MSFRRTLVAGALLAGALSLPGTLIAFAASSLNSIVLQQSEVPSGLKGKSIPYSNVQMAKVLHVSTSQLAQHGRIGGLLVQFSTADTSAKVFDVGSFVSQYKTASGAAWEFKQSYKSDLKNAKPAAAPKVGDESHGLIETQKSGKVTYVTVGLIFRRGAYNMEAAIIGVKGKVTMAQAAQYARLMADRAH